VLLTTNHFESIILTTVKTPDDGTHGVPKYVGGDFVHSLHTYIYIYIYIYIPVHVKL